MNRYVQEQLDLIRDTIVATVPTEQIYLFGSYAYGTPREDGDPRGPSDLDLYVLLKDDVPYGNLDAMDRINEALYDRKSIETDILTIKKSRFEYRRTAPTLERVVSRQGVLIYG
jgi:predicted nucleotidyltransferase